MKKPVATLMADRDEPEKDPETGLTLPPEVSCLPGVVTWIEKHDFENRLVEFIKEVEEEHKRYRGWGKHFNRLDLPLNQSPHRTSAYVYRLFDGVTKLIQRHWKGKEKKKHAQPEAVLLFHNWGMKKITAAAADRSRSRRKRKEDKLPP